MFHLHPHLCNRCFYSSVFIRLCLYFLRIHIKVIYFIHSIQYSFSPVSLGSVEHSPRLIHILTVIISSIIFHCKFLLLLWFDQIQKNWNAPIPVLSSIKEVWISISACNNSAFCHLHHFLCLIGLYQNPYKWQIKEPRKPFLWPSKPLSNQIRHPVLPNWWQNVHFDTFCI